MAFKKRVTCTIEYKKQIFERREQCTEESFTTKRKFLENLVKNNEKRKQPEITDFFAKKHINKK